MTTTIEATQYEITSDRISPEPECFSADALRGYIEEMIEMNEWGLEVETLVFDDTGAYIELDGRQQKIARAVGADPVTSVAYDQSNYLQLQRVENVVVDGRVVHRTIKAELPGAEDGSCRWMITDDRGLIDPAEPKGATIAEVFELACTPGDRRWIARESIERIANLRTRFHTIAENDSGPDHASALGPMKALRDDFQRLEDQLVDVLAA